VIAGGMVPAPRAGTRGPERRGGRRVVSSVSRVMPRFMNSDRVGEAKRSFAVQALVVVNRYVDQIIILP
jgi:hypothetical protein